MCHVLPALKNCSEGSRDKKGSKENKYVCIYLMPPWWPKMELQNFFTLLPIKSSLVDRLWCLRCLNNRNDLPDMIGLFTSGATSSLLPNI